MSSYIMFILTRLNHDMCDIHPDINSGLSADHCLKSSVLETSTRIQYLLAGVSKNFRKTKTQVCTQSAQQRYI